MMHRYLYIICCLLFIQTVAKAQSEDFATITIKASESAVTITINGEYYDKLQPGKTLSFGVNPGDKKRVALENKDGDKYIKEVIVTEQDKGKDFVVMFSAKQNKTAVLPKEYPAAPGLKQLKTTVVKKPVTKPTPEPEATKTGVGGVAETDNVEAESMANQFAIITTTLHDKTLLFKEAMDKVALGKQSMTDNETTTAFNNAKESFDAFKTFLNSYAIKLPKATAAKAATKTVVDSAILKPYMALYESIKAGKRPASKSLVIALKTCRATDLPFWINKKNGDTLIDERPLLLYALENNCSSEVINFVLDNTSATAKEQVINTDKFSFGGQYTNIYNLPLTKACINGDTNVINRLIDEKARFYPANLDEKRVREHAKFLWQIFSANKNVSAVIKRRMPDFPDPSEAIAASIKKIKADMVLVEGGSFKMGCKGDPSDCGPAWPMVDVSVASFYISKYEMTQQLWETIMEFNPSTVQECPDCPVENVSWTGVQAFIQKLNNLTGKKFRLPTEKEWEYAAKGGNKTANYIYAGGNNIDSIAWNKLNSSSIQPVGQKLPNELGLYDMSGNVYEWCNNFYSSNLEVYKTSTEGAPSGVARVIRGGSYRTSEYSAHAVRRYECNEEKSKTDLGFRLVLEP